MFRFKEIKEIKNKEERQLNNVKKEEGYKQIKPEANITNEKCKEYWNSMFAFTGES